VTALIPSIMARTLLFYSLRRLWRAFFHGQGLPSHGSAHP
jgi:hypothetical protein